MSFWASLAPLAQSFMGSSFGSSLMSGLGGGLGRSLGNIPGSYIESHLAAQLHRQQQQKSLPDRLDEHKQFSQQTHDLQLDYDQRRQKSLYPGATTQELLGAPGTTGAGAPSTPFGNQQESNAFVQSQERAADRETQLLQTKLQTDAQRDVARISAQAPLQQASVARGKLEVDANRLSLDQQRFVFEQEMRRAGLSLQTRDVVTREGHLELDKLIKDPDFQTWLKRMSMTLDNTAAFTLTEVTRRAAALAGLPNPFKFIKDRHGSPDDRLAPEDDPEDLYRQIGEESAQRVLDRFLTDRGLPTKPHRGIPGAITLADFLNWWRGGTQVVDESRTPAKKDVDQPPLRGNPPPNPRSTVGRQGR